MGTGYLNISIRNGERELDLRFSQALSLQAVKELICENHLNGVLGLDTDRWYLKPCFKQIRVDQQRPLVQYPLANGDLLEVVVDE